MIFGPVHKSTLPATPFQEAVDWLRLDKCLSTLHTVRTFEIHLKVPLKKRTKDFPHTGFWNTLVLEQLPLTAAQGSVNFQIIT